jgi:hypothetical protein
MRVRAGRTLAVLGVAILASGCAMDLGGWGSDDPQSSQHLHHNPSLSSRPPQINMASLPSLSTSNRPYRPGRRLLRRRQSRVTAALPATPAPAGRMLGEQELRQMLTGKTITVADGRTLEFGRSGSYQETRNGQPIAVGQYRIRDVSVCVQFTNGLSRCDSFVENNGQLFVEDRNGTRLPAQRG